LYRDIPIVSEALQPMLHDNAHSKLGRAAEPLAAYIATHLLAFDSAISPGDQASERALRAFVIHEDHSAGLRARQAFTQIGSRLNLRNSFELHLWNTSLLEDFASRRDAERLAARADIIFMSLRGDRQLPHGLRAWLVDWTMQRERRPCVLVASFDEQFHCSPLVLEILQDLLSVAVPRKLEVVLHFDFTKPETAVSLAAVPEPNQPLSFLADPAA